jgi:hypothetical protein
VAWVITVGVFLGTLIAGVLILFFVSQRDRIREALRKPEHKRIETRTLARLDVELVGTVEPFIREITSTENISRYGARVITKKRRTPRDDVILIVLGKGVSNRARIAYCRPVKEQTFAIGLQFSSPVEVGWSGYQKH